MRHTSIREVLRKVYRTFIPALIAVPDSIAVILDTERLTCVDVGGACGLLPHWTCLNGNAHYILFEPHPGSYRELLECAPSPTARGSYNVVPIGLSGTGGERTLYVTNSPTGSSIMERDESIEHLYESHDYVHPMHTIQIPTKKLSDAIGEVGESRIDMIKLDIQGAEFEVLSSLSESHGAQVLMAEIEIGISKTAVNQKSIGEYNSLMESLGLELLDVRVSRVHLPKKGVSGRYQTENFHVYDNAPGLSARAWEFDGIYFRRAAKLLKNGDVGSIRRLMVAYCAYGFFLEAYRLSEELERCKLMDAPSSQAIGNAIVAWYRTQHGRMLYRPSPFFSMLRKYCAKFSFRGGPRWAQHMWVDYPSC